MSTLYRPLWNLRRTICFLCMHEVSVMRIQYLINVFYSFSLILFTYIEIH